MNRRWVRLVIALFIGGALQETVRISSGKEIGALFFFGAIVSYFLMSGFVYYRNVYQLQRKVDRDLKKNDELIDDI